MRQREGAQDTSEGSFLDESDIEVGINLFSTTLILIPSQEINLYASGLDSATKAAKTIIVFLTQR